MQCSNADADIENRLVDTGVGGKERVGITERVALTYIQYHVGNR